MTTKERERLAFQWQKSSNQYMIMLTIVIGLFSAQGVIPKEYLIIYYWVLSFSIIVFGLFLVILNADELKYTWTGLRDKRLKITKTKKITTVIVYLFNSLVGLFAIVAGGFLMLVLSGLIKI
jgi:hypothetical protein